ncbi:tetratricopeptide repeat protein [Aquibacillus sp. 3ASR75-54]|uniref:Tetratricopeptide repeat protein n=1 Tax=Aquibacillus salsiterrae TaxID=2950439 RepID=A0A9X3WDZ6_9BACI|nr:tetratricopeptide repeat protein [Aquibacillus salsiterrae]
MHSEKEDKVVMFPKWKERLMLQSKQAVKEQRYQDALAIYNKLLDYKTRTHEVYTGKLLCLMELGEMVEAEVLCEQLLATQEEGYSDYIQLYSTLLFQSNQYDKVVELLEDITSEHDLAQQVKEQLMQMYHLSKSLDDDRKMEDSFRLISQFKQAINDRDVWKQWRLIQKWEGLPVEPHLEYLVSILKGEKNPVIKTGIINLLITNNVDKQVEVVKFGKTKPVNPSKLEFISDHEAVRGILLELEYHEQSNPSLLQLIKALLYRFVFVRYPFVPGKEEYPSIAKALTLIGEQQFHLTNLLQEDSHLYEYIKTIMECDQVYLAIIEE